jgi:hypothetical protein
MAQGFAHVREPVDLVRDLPYYVAERDLGAAPGELEDVG